MIYENKSCWCLDKKVWVCQSGSAVDQTAVHPGCCELINSICNDGSSLPASPWAFWFHCRPKISQSKKCCLAVFVLWSTQQGYFKFLLTISQETVCRLSCFWQHWQTEVRSRSGIDQLISSAALLHRSRKCGLYLWWWMWFLMTGGIKLDHVWSSLGQLVLTVSKLNHSVCDM